MKNILLIIISVISIASCASKKVTDKKPVNINEPITSNKAFFETISKKDNFESIKISSKVSIETDRYIPTVDGIFYIENNKKIWTNFYFLLMSQAKALITPSGIKAYEKINKTYIDSDFSYINNLLKVNFIDYSALQNLLLGKTFVPVNEKDFILTQNAQGYLITSAQNQIYYHNSKSNEYKVFLEYSADFILKKVFLQDAKNNNSLEVNYENHEIVGSQNLPKNVKIIIKTNKTDQILIENTKFESLKMETPFSIPTNYTKTEIK